MSDLLQPNVLPQLPWRCSIALGALVVLSWASLLGLNPQALAAPQPGPLSRSTQAPSTSRLDAKTILVLDLKPAPSLDLAASDGEPLYRGLEAIAGISRALLYELSRDRQFTVLGRDQLGTDPGMILTLAEAIEIGRQAGADAVLSGTLEQFTVDESVRSGGRFRDFDTSSTQLTAEVLLSTYLVSTRDGSILETTQGQAKVRRTHSGQWAAGSLDGAARDRYRPLLDEATATAVAQAITNLSDATRNIPALTNQPQTRPRLVMLDFKVAENPDNSQGAGSFLSNDERDLQQRSISQMLVNQLIETDQFTVVYSSTQGWSKGREINMAEAIEIGRQLGGDLVVTGEILSPGLNSPIPPRNGQPGGSVVQPPAIAVPVDGLGNYGSAQTSTPTLPGELNLASPSPNLAGPGFASATRRPPLSAEAYMTGVVDRADDLTEVSVQINSFLIQTHSGQLLERFQLEGRAREFIPPELSARLQAQLYETLWEAAAADAIEQTALAIAESQQR